MEFQIIITMTKEGAISVSGPIDNKLISYGMLELAKESIAQYHENKKKNIVEVSACQVPQLIK